MPHKFLYSSLLASMVFLAIPSHAAIFDYNKVVRDDRGQVVHVFSSGNCVRTEWIAGRDVCAPVVEEVTKVTYTPPPPPPPQVVEQPVDVLTADERVVYFPFDSFELTPQAKQKLDTVAAKLSSASSVKGANIVGTADRYGANSYDQKLSEKRAQAVHNYLAQRGYLNTQVVHMAALGKRAPITHCSTSLPREEQIACLAPDRRVELQVQYTETHLQKTLVQPAAYTPPPPPGEVMYTQPAAPVSTTTTTIQYQ